MDAFQARLARIALDVVGNRGFVLGGGHAVQLHGMAEHVLPRTLICSAWTVAGRRRSRPTWWRRSEGTGSR